MNAFPDEASCKSKLKEYTFLHIVTKPVTSNTTRSSQWLLEPYGAPKKQRTKSSKDYARSRCIYCYFTNNQ